MNFLYTEFIYFVIYSFLGWVCETIYCSAYKKEFVNRGFLMGPFCPIYAFGALSVIKLFKNVNNPFMLFFLGAVVASIIEYIGSCILESIFKLKLWDYSERKFNIHGRVCLKNSCMFGLMSVITIVFIQPFIGKLTLKFPSDLVVFTSICFLVYFILDIVLTVYNIMKLNGVLKQLQELTEELNEAISNSIYKQIENIKKEKEEQYAKIKDYIEQLNCKISKLKQYNKDKSFFKRIIKAFPSMRSLKYQEPLNKIIDEFKKYKRH